MSTHSSYRENQPSYIDTLGAIPSHATPDIAMHTGAWRVADPEHLKRRAEAQMTAAWAILANGLDIDPALFPQTSIHIWAPIKGEACATRGESIRDAVYSMRPLPRTFQPSTQLSTARASYRPGFLNRLDLQMTKKGDLSLSDAAHELGHAFMDSQGAHISADLRLSPAGKVFNEGIGRLGNQFAYEHRNDRPTSSARVEDFREFATEVQSEPPNRHNGNLAQFAYSSANTWTHRYLLEERGGIDPLIQVGQLATNSTLVATYEKVYGQNLSEIIRDAGSWHAERFA